MRKIISLILCIVLLVGMLISCDANGNFKISINSGTESSSSAETTTNAEPDPEPKPETNPESKPESNPESNPESKPESNPESKPDPEVNYSITLPSATQGGTSINYSAPSTEITEISSAAAVLIDMNSGNAIAGKNADVRIHPASMTKVMTLLVACEKAQNAGRLLTVEQWMIDYQQSKGASGILGFVAGDQISVESALYLINYKADMIACLLIAQYIAGNEADFVSLMNQKAADLGLKDTHFVNTTGLQDPNHYTTCREMAIIMNAAMNNPTASKIITSYVGTIIPIYSDYDDGHTTPYRQPIIYSSWYSDRMKDDPRITDSSFKIIGGKTGYEDIPTGCFVTVAKNSANGKQYICVNVGRINETQNTVSASQSTEDTITIYKNYCAANFTDTNDIVYAGAHTLNLRTTPSTNGTVIKTVPFGTKLNRSQTNGEWDKVTLDGDTTVYYVLHSWTTTNNADFQFIDCTPASVTVKTTDSKVQFYLSPFVNNDLEIALENAYLKDGFKASDFYEGYTLTRVAMNSNWVKVIFTGTVKGRTVESATFYIQTKHFTNGRLSDPTFPGQGGSNNPGTVIG